MTDNVTQINPPKLHVPTLLLLLITGQLSERGYPWDNDGTEAICTEIQGERWVISFKSLAMAEFTVHGAGFGGQDITYEAAEEGHQSDPSDLRQCPK